MPSKICSSANGQLLPKPPYLSSSYSPYPFLQHRRFPRASQVSSLEYMLQIVDEAGQLRFDTIQGTGPIQIIDLMKNGAEIADSQKAGSTCFCTRKIAA